MSPREYDSLHYCVTVSQRVKKVFIRSTQSAKRDSLQRHFLSLLWSDGSFPTGGTNPKRGFPAEEELSGIGASAIAVSAKIERISWSHYKVINNKQRGKRDRDCPQGA